MMSETSAGHHPRHEASTGKSGQGSLTPKPSAAASSSSSSSGLTQWQRYAIEYKTAISASIGAAVSAVVG
jgi:hypothetical protein